MTKKGSLLDLTHVLVMLFVFAFITILMFNVYGHYKDSVDFDSDAYNQTVVDADATLAVLDYVYVFFLVGFVILTIVSSFSIKSHPLFFFVSLFLLLITVVMGVILSNVYEEITTVEEFSDDEYTIIPFVMSHLPTFILMIGAVLVIVLYAKSRWDDG